MNRNGNSRDARTMTKDDSKDDKNRAPDQDECIVSGGDPLPGSCQCMSAAPCFLAEEVACTDGSCRFVTP